MSGYAFRLSGETLVACGSGALWWPERRVLTVSDLHLGRSGRFARRGGALLPPYETDATLERLETEIARLDPAMVICLGDSFDDDAAAGELAEAHRNWLLRMMAGRDWLWIAGNHDPAPEGLAGSLRVEMRIGGLVFRHIAAPGAAGEVSGHYHPKARLAGRVRPCFLANAGRVILPAFGTYTGGLECRDPAFSALMQPPAMAILTGREPIPLPL
ncbi:MAG: ligase-associated DNA damage response endonuclease PdeM [Pseudorhodobacter sp.]